MDKIPPLVVGETLRQLSQEAYETAKGRGFYPDGESNLLEKNLTALHCEVSEVYLALREGKKGSVKHYMMDCSDNIQSQLLRAEAYETWVKNSLGAELASVVINAMSIAASQGVDLGFHIPEEMWYNGYRAELCKIKMK